MSGELNLSLNGNRLAIYRKSVPGYQRTLNSLISLYHNCKKSETRFLPLLFRLGWYRVVYSKTFLVHQGTVIKGINNILATEKVEIGTHYTGFMHKKDNTLLNIRGKLIIMGKYSIGRGCRFDVGENATLTIGKGGYVNNNSHFIIMHKLSIGDDCAISWDCQFLDEDFHSIHYPGRKETENGIHIGNRVWIGCGVKIFKGSHIPDGCVIASDSVVKGRFEKENCLIGGHPARVLKEDIRWN